MKHMVAKFVRKLWNCDQKNRCLSIALELNIKKKYYFELKRRLQKKTAKFVLQNILWLFIACPSFFGQQQHHNQAFATIFTGFGPLCLFPVSETEKWRFTTIERINTLSLEAFNVISNSVYLKCFEVRKSATLLYYI